MTDVWALALRYQPLRRRLSGPETHAERMERTDRQLEEDRRRRALEDRLVEAQADWARVRDAYEAQRNAPAHAVAHIHRPVIRDGELVCEGCFSIDEYGDFNDTWACDTFIVLKELSR